MEPIFAAYSFADVQATLSGQFGVILLGNGSGSSDEGISFEAIEERNRMTIGADGSGFHTLIQSRAARAMVRILKTSPTNAALQQMFNAQSQSSLFWGQNVFAVSNPVMGDVASATGVAFGKQPGNQWGKDPNVIEWEFHCIRASFTMGGNIVSIG
jgi:hypothetical protein